MSLGLRYWCASHPGTMRTTNQDAYLCRPDLGLFVVADGVGAQAGGGLASATVTRALNTIEPGLGPRELLRDVRARLEAAHRQLMAEATGEKGGIAATTVVALLLHDRHLACLWAGDSRAYRLRQGTLMQLTFDHSLVGEMQRAGELTVAEAEAHPAANVITRAIGAATDSPLVDRVIDEIAPGDRFLLCSDGLTKTLSHKALATVLQQDDPACALVAAAIAMDVADNVTAVVAAV